MGNREVIQEFKDAFYNTGKRPSKFVHFTYKFNVLNITENNTKSCVNHTSRYIWSDQFLYLLLGPKSLFWFTVFAVPRTIPEHSATINLTELCLCSDAYKKLISRLTYMVSTYIAT